MPVIELNHYFVRSNDLERSRRFYCDVLGFEVMARPKLPFPGYWLGASGRVHIHMGPHGMPEAERFYAGTTAKSATDNTGVVDHIAFTSTDPKGFLQRLDALGHPARKRYFRDFGLFQIVVQDPDGVTIELNFADVPYDPVMGEAIGTM